MSSSFGYNYVYVDREAERRRLLRAEIAELRQQLSGLEQQAAALQKRSGRRRASRSEATAPSRDATADQLDAAATDLRASIAAVRHDVDEGLKRFWANRISAGLGAGGLREREAPTTATEELGQLGPDPTARSATSLPTPLPAVERDTAVAEAEALLARQGQRCDPADLGLLERLLAELRTLDEPAAIRKRSFEIRTVVKASIDRRTLEQKGEIVRARLLTLVEDVLPEDNERLRALVTAAPDPGLLTREVTQAIARADKARSRAAVARATGEALREIGCDVGEEFVTLLADKGQSVAAFDDAWPGYGLVVRLPKDQTKLVAAVVRRDDVAASRQQDLAVQRGFCDHKLEQVASRLRKRIGISSTPFLRLAPGQHPVGTVAASDWPDAGHGQVADASTTTWTSQSRPVQQRPVQERRGER
jgi:hypothetical protein